MDKEAIQVNIFQTQETFYPEISEKKLELSCKIPDNTIISVDRELFARAFLNIMKVLIFFQIFQGKKFLEFG